MAIVRLRARAVVILAAIGLSACGPVHSSRVYAPWQAGEAQVATRGTLVAMRDVVVAGESSGLGLIGGGVIGGVGGSSLGKGSRAAIAGAAAGAILGAVAGSVAESQLTQATATEFTVREDSGHVLAVVQANDEWLRPGERVLLLRGSSVRVVRDAAPPASGASAIGSPPPVVGAPPPSPVPPQTWAPPARPGP